MNTAIKVENLSKIYRLGEIGTGTISQDLERWVKMNVLGKEDPFLKIGESNDRSQKGSSDLVYSLQDLNFEIQQGDAVGIIGRNGAGKSTLLKILSRVTSPTKGKINIKGRVASLLEVGTGFHPELTGRENIYINGAILGMRKREIDRKLDEIIDFSGVERYIDTPVKRYSSGMYVRLAFAVAAHLESEILIVDEVLAVGDAEFQKKCLGKMGEVSMGEGRTVLFVSHNMGSIREICNKGLLLENGQISDSGFLKSIIDRYQNNLQQSFIFNPIGRKGNGSNRVKNIFIVSKSVVGQDLKINIEFLFWSLKSRFDLRIENSNGVRIGWLSTSLIQNSSELVNPLSIIISKLPLVMGKYYIQYCLYHENEVADWCEKALVFEVEEGIFYPSFKLPPIEQAEFYLDFEIC
jgi:lipopolysaccharide transport system ATP-binding protein